MGPGSGKKNQTKVVLPKKKKKVHGGKGATAGWGTRPGEKVQGGGKKGGGAGR